jgi:hypothetical protein
METLEEEVWLSQAYQEENEVKEQVREIITHLGLSNTKDTKFYCMVELYWHDKTMLANGILPKEQDYRKFIQQLVALEEQNKLLLEMVSEIVKRNGGSFQLIKDSGKIQYVQGGSQGSWVGGLIS